MEAFASGIIDGILNAKGPEAEAFVAWSPRRPRWPSGPDRAAIGTAPDFPSRRKRKTRQGVRAPDRARHFVATMAVTPLRWLAKARKRLLLPLVVGRGWAARIRDVHCPDPGQFRRASFSCARGRSSL
jgi:hypothetical protein